MSIHSVKLLILYTVSRSIGISPGLGYPAKSKSSRDLNSLVIFVVGLELSLGLVHSASGNYSPHIAPADAMVINFGVKNQVEAL